MATVAEAVAGVAGLWPSAATYPVVGASVSGIKPWVPPTRTSTTPLGVTAEVALARPAGEFAGWVEDDLQGAADGR